MFVPHSKDNINAQRVKKPKQMLTEGCQGEWWRKQRGGESSWQQAVRVYVGFKS